MRAAILCLSLSMALLAGCSKGPGAPPRPNGPPPGPAPAPKAAAPGAAAFFNGRPQRKPGLWRMTVATDSGPGLKLAGEICLDAATDRTSSFTAARGAMKDCGRPTFRPSLGGISFDSTCKFGSRTVTTHGVASGDFNKAYTLETTTRTDPPLPGGGEVKTRIAAQWLGPCLPGQVPGKMSMKVTGLGQG